MKKLLLLNMLLAIAIGFTTCSGGGGDDEPSKSKACDITSFKDGTREWVINGTNITGSYPKGSNVNNVSPTIEVSKNAVVKPATGVGQDFSSGKTVTYTVTAEDGKTTKTYTAQATVATTN